MVRSSDPPFPPRLKQVTLSSSLDDDDAPAFPLKSLLIGVLILGVVGTGFIDQIQKSIRDSTNSQQTKRKELKNKSVEGDRGALTKLTRREINLKLAQVPVFYTADCPGESCAAMT